MNNSFVMYRLPHETTCTIMRQCDGGAEVLPSYTDLNGRTGFVFSPFVMSAEHPLLLIRPDEVKQCEFVNDYEPDPVVLSNRDIDNEMRQYETDFVKFHSQLLGGDFKKIVLARCCEEKSYSQISPRKIFMRACLMYPNEFVALVSTPDCGIWLMATPEILVEGHNDEWHTMALAGTRRTDGLKTVDNHEKGTGVCCEWDEKNIREQQYVAEYIRDCLSCFSSEINETLPNTLKAGKLMHIVTYFNFKLKEKNNIGHLVEALHPTPAVCGLPKEKVYKFILNNESGDRRYYSGFSGPLNCDGTTHLFVTLRCMQIDGSRCRLYAGGGLLSESDVKTEWLETEAKMDTMRRCLAIKRI